MLYQKRNRAAVPLEFSSCHCVAELGDDGSELSKLVDEMARAEAEAEMERLKAEQEVSGL